jgi:hypothetical protein
MIIESVLNEVRFPIVSAPMRSIVKRSPSGGGVGVALSAADPLGVGVPKPEKTSVAATWARYTIAAAPACGAIEIKSASAKSTAERRVRCSRQEIADILAYAIKLNAAPSADALSLAALKGEIVALKARETKRDKDAETARSVAQHISFADPQYLSRDDVPAEAVETERRIVEAFNVLELTL